MTLIDDAKKLFDDCQIMEDSIYDTVYYKYNDNNIDVMQKRIEQVPAMVNECHEIFHKLLKEGICARTTLCNDLLRMTMRLEAAVMYAKNYFKLN
jgi:hypothetical protein